MTVFRGTILQLLSGVSPKLKDYKTVVFQASINSRGLLVERFPAPEVLVEKEKEAKKKCMYKRNRSR